MEDLEPKNDKETSPLKNLLKVLPYLTEYKWKVATVVAGSIIFAIFRLVDPYIYKIILDEILVKTFTGYLDPMTAVKTVALSCFAIFLLRIATSSIFGFYSYMSMEIGDKLEMRMFRDALGHLQSLDMAFHHNRNSGEILARVDRGIDGLRRVLHDNISKFFLPGSINIVCLVGWIFYQNWKLALAATTFIPLLLYFSLKKAKPIYIEQSKINKAYEKIYHRAYEGVYNIEAVVSFNASRHELDLFDKERIPALHSQLQIARWWRILGFHASFFEVLGRIAVIILGTWLVTQKATTPGEIIMFLAYIAMLYQQLPDMITVYLSMQQDLSKVQRFFNLRNIEPKVKESADATEMLPVKHAIELKNVSFSYGEGKETLKQINLAIPVGQKIAIVGHTGSGKTTLANLVQRYYDPTSGIITFDGTDLRKLKLDSMRRQITIVPQHALLFSRTIRENIAYGHNSPDDEAIVAAAKIANAHDFIETKPDKYNTMIGEKGIKLSGGEQQRISIARAIYCNASVIIMDEATSHLDADSEAIVQDALWKLLEGKTAIIIAHRLSTILKADSIVVMENGEIVDQGTNEELMARCGMYQRLYNRQFRIEETED